MTIGDMIAQLRTIQDIFGDVPMYLEIDGLFYVAIQQVNYRVANSKIDLPNRAELSIKRPSALNIEVSDSASLGDQPG